MFCVLYTTAPSEDVAVQLADALVERSLVACVNIVPGGTSIYRWEGTIEREAEVFVLMKTTLEKRDAAIEAIETLHPYETPCATSWPIAAGSDAYLDWIAASVGSEREPFSSR